MSHVLLDGEKVEFSGPEPESVGALRALLEQALGERGRVLADLRIDDVAFDEAHAGEALRGRRVEATSLTLAAAVAQVGRALVPEIEALQRELRLLACEILRAPWAEVQPRCVSQVEATATVMQRAVEVASVLGEESAAARSVGALATTVERWMDLIHARDAAGIALQLDGEVAPTLEKVARVLAEPPGA